MICNIYYISQVYICPDPRTRTYIIYHKYMYPHTHTHTHTHRTNRHAQSGDSVLAAAYILYENIYYIYIIYHHII